MADKTHLGNCLGVDGGVEGQVSQDGVQPRRHGHLQLVGREVEPRVNLRGLEEGHTVQLGVATQTADVAGDGVGLADEALLRLQHGDLAQRVLGQEGLAQVLVASDVNVLLGDGNAVVRGGDQRLVRAEVSRERVDGLRQRNKNREKSGMTEVP